MRTVFTTLYYSINSTIFLFSFTALTHVIVSTATPVYSVKQIGMNAGRHRVRMAASVSMGWPPTIAVVLRVSLVSL